MAAFQSTFVRAIDSMKGGWIETGEFTVTPGVVSNNTSVEIAADVSPTCKVGDQLFVNAQNIPAGEIVVGARVTATNTAKVKLANYSGSNVTDSTQTTYDYLLVHMS